MRVAVSRVFSLIWLAPFASSPVAGRELTVAARRPGTYRVRTYSVAVALILLCLVSRSHVTPSLLGHQLLSALGVAALGFCMFMGLFLTSNSIASEKQGGTIGLLFLTDLKGRDIVLGKLAAYSINAFFALLAVCPVLATPLLMGSVTGAEFVRMLLALGTTLFFSLALGLAVSSRTNDPKLALGWAILLMALTAGLLPVLWWLQDNCLKWPGLDFLFWPSPAFAFHACFDASYRTRFGRGDFWHSLLTIWCLAIFCLAWASFFTPRSWLADELKTRKTQDPRKKPAAWARAEAELPYCRVAFRDRTPSLLAKLILGVALPIWLCFFFAVSSYKKMGPPMPLIVCLLMGCGLHIIVKLLITVQCVSRLNNDRNSGALELLLATPLRVDSILGALTRAMRTHFLLPLLALCLLNLALMVLIFGTDMIQSDQWIFVELFIGGMVSLFADSEALLWVGMWRGVSSRQAYKAIIITILQVLGPCWLYIFVLVFTEPRTGGPEGVALLFASFFALGWIVDALSMTAARRKLRDRFRDMVAERYDKAD